MELNIDWSHSSYSPYALLLVSLAYSTVVAGIALLCSRRFEIRRTAFWLGFGVISWIPLLVFGGQHFPGIDHFTSSQFCFGEPGVLHVIALILPPLAVLAASSKNPSESSGATAP